MDATKVAVIGSGLMGGGIAQACAQAGFTVVNIDIAQEPLDKVRPSSASSSRRRSTRTR